MEGEQPDIRSGVATTDVPLPGMSTFHSTREYLPLKERAWHLSLLCAPGMNAWCVHDAETGACVALATGENAATPEAHRMPPRPASVSFTVMPEISTLVPEGVLAGGNEAAHLALVHGTLPGGTLRDEPIDALNARCIYLHDEAAERRVLKEHPAARPVSLRNVLVGSALARSVGGPTLLLHRADQRCDVVIADGTRVLLANSFFAPAATDVLYFALFAAERAGVAPTTCALLYGGWSRTTEESDLLTRYFQRCTPAIEATDRNIAGLGLPAPEHWLALIEQAACAS
jgi:hypothetical protein